MAALTIIRSNASGLGNLGQYFYISLTVNYRQSLSAGGGGGPPTIFNLPTSLYS